MAWSSAGHYLTYYDNQVGGGARSVHGVFVGAPYQRGHGIGSFLGGLFRSVLPLLKRGAQAIGREALRAGINVIEDVSGKKRPFAESVRRRINESGGNLKRKAAEKMDLLMSGSGYVVPQSKRGMHSLIGPLAASVRQKRRRRVVRGKVVKRKIRTGKRQRKTRKKKKKKNQTGQRTGASRKRKTKKRGTSKKRKTSRATDIFGGI